MGGGGRKSDGKEVRQGKEEEGEEGGGRRGGRGGRGGRREEDQGGKQLDLVKNSFPSAC